RPDRARGAAGPPARRRAPGRGARAGPPSRRPGDRARMTRALVALLCAVVLAATGAGCVADTRPAGDVADRTVHVTATTNFIADLAQEIGGDRVRVTGLMGPGVDPHLYKASAGDVEALRGADIIF